MKSQNYDDEDAQDFLDKVNSTTQQIEDLISGKLDVDAFDKQFGDKQKMEKVKAEIAEREAQEKIRKGRPGKGYKGEFKTYCKGCQTEFFIDGIDKCTNCGYETITKEVSLRGLFLDFLN